MPFLSFLFYISIFFTPQFTLQEGDILFQDSDCGPFCEAIEKVTEGYKGSNLSHVGMVIVSEEGDLKVLEAIGKGVVMTSMEEFLNRSFDASGNAKVIVGRINKSMAHLIPSAIKHAESLLGKQYDSVFDINNDQYYCSELIYESFKHANLGNDVFQLHPMTFIDPDTESTFNIWVNYYKDLGVAIPEGDPGLNPGSISKSSAIEIVHIYGIPSGMVE